MPRAPRRPRLICRVRSESAGWLASSLRGCSEETDEILVPVNMSIQSENLGPLASAPRTVTPLEEVHRHGLWCRHVAQECPSTKVSLASRHPPLGWA